MAITITTEQFKRETRSRWYSRPTALERVDRLLADYHRCKFTRNKVVLVATLEVLQDKLNAWTENKETIPYAGGFRYNSVRDESGFITQLEVEIEQALVSARRELWLQTTINVANAMSSNPVIQQNRQNVAAGHDNRLRQLTRDGYGLGRSNAGMELGPEVDFLGETHSISSLFNSNRHSLASFESESDRNSFHAGQEAPGTITAQGFLTDQAYQAGALFLQYGWNANVTPQQLKTAARQANPTLAMPNQVTFMGLYQGLEALGYQGMYFRQHCTLVSVVDTLMGATPMKPMMVVVGGNTPQFTAVVVTGHRYDALGAGTNIYFTATDALRPHNYVRFIHTGEYTQQDMGGNREVAALIPNLGILKLSAA